MTIESRSGALGTPSSMVAVLLAEDDTEESVIGSDLHQEAVSAAREVLRAYNRARQATGAPPWYASSQVTLLVDLPGSDKLWQPKPDVFVVVGLAWESHTSYDTRQPGPMPQFVLEVASLKAG
jgi:hypothetical protein